MPLLEDDRTDDLEDLYDAPSASDDDLPPGHPSRSDLQNEEEQAQSAHFGPSRLKNNEDAAEAAKADKTDDDNNPGRKWKKIRRNKAKEPDEDELLNKRLKEGLFKAHDDDMAARGKKKGDRGYKKMGGGLFGLLRRRKAMGGIGIAVVGLLLSGMGLFSFLNIFKLDHILQNIDANTFSKFNASFTDRSDKYLRAYINLRLSEIEGTKDHDTLIFRANRIDTNHPMRDLYRSLRTGSFEKQLLDKHKIRFTSIAVENPDGSVTLRPAQINFENHPKLFQQFEAREGGKSLSGKKYLKGQLDADLSKFIDGLDADTRKSLVRIFDAPSDARTAIKKTLNDHTRFLSVAKRRHLRKDIQNMTGINDWRFFERSRNKITAKKVAVQRKIIQKVVPENQVGKFIACILGAGKCPSTNDPVAAENRQGGTPAGAAVPGDTTATEQVGPDGQVITTTNDDGDTVTATTGDYSAADTANELTDNVGGLGDELLEEGTDGAFTPNQAFALKQINSFIGNPWTKAWSFFKKLTTFHNNIIGRVFVKVAKQARLQQLSAYWATLSIARDQARTGQNTPEEMSSLMETLAGAERSEGWINLMQNGANKASAAEQVVQVANAKEYAKLSPDQQQKQPVQYFLHRPNDGRAEALTEGYIDSFAYQIINPIAQIVNGVNDSIVGRVVNSVFDLADSLLSKITDPLMKAVLNITGAQDDVAKVTALAMTSALEFMGAGPIDMRAGQINFAIAGSAAMAESSLRSAGAVKSTPQTANRARVITAAYKAGEEEKLTAFDRYASLNNPKSVASKAMFSVTTFSLSERMSSMFSSIASLPSSFVSIFSGRSSAAGEFNAAEWAGVDSYDIPPACLDLDPLLPTIAYTDLAVGLVSDSAYAAQAQGIVDKIRPELTIDLIRNGNAFWDKVYGAIGENSQSEEIAGAIYNCALFDQRVMGGLGYTSGYTKDSGYGNAP